MIASRSATLCGVASLFISLGIAAQERPPTKWDRSLMEAM